MKRSEKERDKELYWWRTDDTCRPDFACHFNLYCSLLQVDLRQLITGILRTFSTSLYEYFSASKFEPFNTFLKRQIVP